MRHLDLFSGIGGFALALDNVYDNNTHTFVEYDPFCQEVLKKHWPDSSIFGDIKLFSKEQFATDSRSKELGRISQKPREKGHEIGHVDILTGGFPCQPFSQAGRRRGEEDDRFLWPDMFRIIGEFGPEWVIAENVCGLLTQGGGVVFERVCTDLESADYEVQPIIIPAVSKGAPHRRDRIWFVAHRRFKYGSERGNERMEEDKTKRTSRIVDPQRCNQNAPDTECEGHAGQEYQAGQSARHHSGLQPPDWTANWAKVATELCRVDDGISKRLDRNPRLKALGNAIVPQVAEEILKAIKASS